jgi:hypothetical protein
LKQVIIGVITGAVSAVAHRRSTVLPPANLLATANAVPRGSWLRDPVSPRADRQPVQARRWVAGAIFVA